MITTTDSSLRRLQRAWREIESHEFWFLSGWGEGGCGDTDEGKSGRGFRGGLEGGKVREGSSVTTVRTTVGTLQVI